MWKMMWYWLTGTAGTNVHYVQLDGVEELGLVCWVLNLKESRQIVWSFRLDILDVLEQASKSWVCSVEWKQNIFTTSNTSTVSYTSMCTAFPREIQSSHSLLLSSISNTCYYAVHLFGKYMKWCAYHYNIHGDHFWPEFLTFFF
jgi:hypothetical protein